MNLWQRLADSDLYHSFRRSRLTVAAALVALVLMLAALFAPWLALHDPFDVASLTLVALVLSVNLLGDWLRDALNPRLR